MFRLSRDDDTGLMFRATIEHEGYVGVGDHVERKTAERLSYLSLLLQMMSANIVRDHSDKWASF
jgi:hypothetical protein